ncbi:heparan-alpha-glucosaminide N-acetyltransferase domain-containing protein [Nocardioides zeae]
MTRSLDRLRALPTPLARARTLVRPPRLAAVDVARALAVLGMVGAHVGSTAELVWSDPSTWDGLVHGRSSVLFAVLAGVSVALLTGRTRRPDPADLPALRLSLVGRGAAIFGVGLAVELLGTSVAVILTLYGLLYVAALPFLRWRPSRLIAGAVALAVAGPPLLAVLRAVSLDAYGPGIDLALFGVYPITVWLALLLAGMALGRCDLARLRTAVLALAVGATVAAIGYGTAAAVAPALDRLQERAWADSADGADVAGSDSTVPDDLQSGVPGGDLDLDGLVCDVGGFGSYCYDPAPLATTPGSDLDGSGDVDGALADEEPPGYLEQLREQHVRTDVLLALGSDEPHSGATLEVLGSGGFAIGVIGLLLLVVRRGVRWLFLPLAALGSLPLTAYAAHVVVIRVVGGSEGYIASNATWGWLSLGLVVGCTVWALLLGRGPLERAVARAARAMARGA